MEKITDIELYNTQMSRSMQDKLFFLNEIKESDASMIIDFGCANGELLKQVPYSWNKIGIDNSVEMREEAVKNFSGGLYFDNLNEVSNIDKSNAILNLSSVIHEIYSYLPKEEVDKFWDQIFNSNYKYIVIRDMMISEKTNRDMTLDDVRMLCLSRQSSLFRDFHSLYHMWRVRDMIHFFMKYRYTENWEREKRENYFPITKEELIALIPKNYEIVYHAEYALDWTKNKIKEDFGYELKDNTHIKLILKRVDIDKN